MRDLIAVCTLPHSCVEGVEPSACQSIPSLVQHANLQHVACGKLSLEEGLSLDQACWCCICEAESDSLQAGHMLHQARRERSPSAGEGAWSDPCCLLR